MMKTDLRRARRAALIAFAALVTVCLAPAAWAQNPPLGEVAKKEQERRKTQKPSGKAYTNKDLPESAQGRTAAPAQTSAAPAGPATSSHGHPPATEAGSETKPEQPAGQSGDQKDETWWRNRITIAREALRRNEAFAEALQSRINGLSTDFASRDDPFQRAKIGEDRDKALAELARVKAEIAAGKKMIEDIEEEARKSSVPPGWLR
jgi:hypothetical protein